MNNEHNTCECCTATLDAEGLCPRCSEDDGDPWTPEEREDALLDAQDDAGEPGFVTDEDFGFDPYLGSYSDDC